MAKSHSSYDPAISLTCLHAHKYKTHTHAVFRWPGICCKYSFTFLVNDLAAVTTYIDMRDSEGEGLERLSEYLIPGRSHAHTHKQSHKGTRAYAHFEY